MEDANLILIAQTLSTQLGRIADSLERIERSLNVTSTGYTETVKTEHGPTDTGEPYNSTAAVIDKTRTYTQEEFRRLAQ